MLGAVRVGDFQKRLKPWKACEWQDWGYRQKSSGSLLEVVGTKGSGPRGWTGTAQNSEMRGDECALSWECCQDLLFWNILWVVLR